MTWFPKFQKLPRTQEQKNITGCVVHEKSCVPWMVLEGKHEYISVISGFCCDVDDICALLGYYAASNGNPLPTFQDTVSVPPSRVKNISKELPFDAA
jgi:hypothetical protein